MLDIRLLRSFGTTAEHHDHLGVALDEVDAPPRTDVDAQFRNAFANWRNVAHQTEGQTLDARQHHTAHRDVCQSVQPFGKFG